MKISLVLGEKFQGVDPLRSFVSSGVPKSKIRPPCRLQLGKTQRDWNDGWQAVSSGGGFWRVTSSMREAAEFQKNLGERVNETQRSKSSLVLSLIAEDP